MCVLMKLTKGRYDFHKATSRVGADFSVAVYYVPHHHSRSFSEKVNERAKSHQIKVGKNLEIVLFTFFWWWWWVVRFNEVVVVLG